MDLEFLHDKYCKTTDSQLVDRVVKSLEVAALNHVYAELPELEYRGQGFNMYVYDVGHLYIRSDSVFKFVGMHRQARSTKYGTGNVHLLPRHMLEHVANELPKRIDNFGSDVDALYRAAASSILNYSLQAEVARKEECRNHPGGCGEIVKKLRTVILSLVHDVRLAVENMSAVMNAFVTAEFGMFLNVAEVRLNFYANADDREHIVKGCIEPKITVRAHGVETLELSDLNVGDTKALLQLRNYLFSVGQFQPMTIEINWQK